MATIPLILQLCGYEGNGGNPGLRAAAPITPAVIPDLLTHFGDIDLRAIIPHDALGESTSTALSWWPWFDSSFSSTTYIVGAAPTTTVITDAGSPGWTINAFAGRLVTVRESAIGTGFECRGVCTSNTISTITCSAGFKYLPTGATVTPTVGFDYWIGDTGGFTDFHPSAGHTTIGEFAATTPKSTRGGAGNLSNAQGIGPEAGMLRQLWENVHKVDPYFLYWKFGGNSATGQSWASGGSFRTALQAELALVQTAFTARYGSGHTLQIQLVIWWNNKADIDRFLVSFPDIVDLKADTESVITWLRSASVSDNSTCKVLLVNDDYQIDNVDAPGYQGLLSRVHRAVVDDGLDVGVVDLVGIPVRGADPGLGINNENAEFYHQDAYHNEIPRRLRIGYEALINSTVKAQDGGLPTYILIGDSIFVGAISATFTTNIDSTAYPIGARANQYIYNRATGLGEPYEVHENSNTSGTAPAAPHTAGPDYSLTALLADIHPDGFLLIKRASNGSGLATTASDYSAGTGGRWAIAYTATEHFGELRADYNGAALWANGTLGKQLDLKGVFVSLGTNDCATANGAGTGATFVSTLTPFVEDLRTTFGTRTSGALTPIIWRQPQTGMTGVITAEITAVRDGLEALALVDSNFIVADMDALDRDLSDNVHETPASSVIDGELLYKNLRTMTF